MIILVVLHVVFAILLILAVLLQTGKAGDLGAVFGGGASQSLFGASGSKAIIVKITWVLLVVFFLTSLGLATFSPKGPRSPLQEKLKKQMNKEQNMPPAPAPAQQPEAQQHSTTQPPSQQPPSVPPPSSGK